MTFRSPRKRRTIPITGNRCGYLAVLHDDRMMQDRFCFGKNGPLFKVTLFISQGKQGASAGNTGAAVKGGKHYVSELV